MTLELRQAVVQEGWFDDEELNRVSGFGGSYLGRLEARKAFLEGLEAGIVKGIYRNSVPVGLLVERRIGNRTADVWVFVAPSYRGKGIGPQAAAVLADQLFSNGIYRIQASVVTINHAGTSFAHGLGMIGEGKLVASWWMDKNPFDVVVYRVLRRDWEHMMGVRS